MFTLDHLEHLAHHQVGTQAKAVTHQVHKIVNSTALMLQQNPSTSASNGSEHSNSNTATAEE